MGLRVLREIKEIQNLAKDEIRAVLPLPQAEGWKFARALPPALLSDLSLSDYYHVEEFMNVMKHVPVFILDSALCFQHHEE